MSPERVELSVVLPAYNEAGFLAGAVEKVLACCAELIGGREGAFEVLLVENGSADRTWDVALALAAAHPHLRALRMSLPDYGGAIRAGLAAATGEWVAVLDVDQIDDGFLAGAWEERDALDVALGSKRAVGSSDLRSPLRRVASRVFTGLLHLGLGMRASDSHGSKLLRRSAIEPLAKDTVSRQDIFDTELVLRAERAGLRIVELPVTVVETRPPRSNIARRVPRTLLGLAKMRLALGQPAQTPAGPRPPASFAPIAHERAKVLGGSGRLP